MSSRGAAERSSRQTSVDWSTARRIAAGAVPTVETVAVATAVGRVTAAAVASPRRLPHCSTSAMDGWAVCGPGPWALVERASTHGPGGRLGPSTATAILTGGALPDATTGILRSEWGVVEAGRLRSRAPAGGSSLARDIRPAGEQAEVGTELCAAGRRLTAIDVALLCSAGVDTVQVGRRPLVSLIVTGTEVLTSGQPQAGQVRDAFAPGFPPLVESWGGRMSAVAFLDDEQQTLSAALASAVAGGADLIITTGGTAHSCVDQTVAAAEAAGFRFEFGGIDLRPGKHTRLARSRDRKTWLLALSGNPFAAYIGLSLYAETLIRALSGAAFLAPSSGILEIGRVERHARVVPVSGEPAAGAWRRVHQPTTLRGLAAADALAIVPAGAAPGMVEIALLPAPGGLTSC